MMGFVAAPLLPVRTRASCGVRAAPAPVRMAVVGPGAWDCIAYDESRDEHTMSAPHRRRSGSAAASHRMVARVQPVLDSMYPMDYDASRMEQFDWDAHVQARRRHVNGVTHRNMRVHHKREISLVPHNEVDTDPSSGAQLPLAATSANVNKTPRVARSSEPLLPRRADAWPMWAMADFDESRMDQFDWDTTSAGQWSCGVGLDPSRLEQSKARNRAAHSDTTRDRVLLAMAEIMFAERRALVERCSAATGRCVLVASVILDSGEARTVMFGTDQASIDSFLPDMPDNCSPHIVSPDVWKALQRAARTQFRAEPHRSPSRIVSKGVARIGLEQLHFTAMGEGEGI